MPQLAIYAIEFFRPLQCLKNGQHVVALIDGKRCMQGIALQDAVGGGNPQVACYDEDSCRCRIVDCSAFFASSIVCGVISYRNPDVSCVRAADIARLMVELGRSVTTMDMMNDDKERFAWICKTGGGGVDDGNAYASCTRDHVDSIMRFIRNMTVDTHTLGANYNGTPHTS